MTGWDLKYKTIDDDSEPFKSEGGVIISLQLTLKQLELLSDKLFELRDEGPENEGWASEELKELRSLVSKEIDKHNGTEVSRVHKENQVKEKRL